MSSERPPPKPSPPADARAAREAKLAQALRANLRRRKAPPPAKPEPPPGGDSA